MRHEPKIDVIICAYTEERWDDIVEAIASVNAQSQKPNEIVLVIDHNDDLHERARQQFTEGVKIVANHHKQGLSGARNTGIESSTGDVLAFLDDDATAEPGWLAAMSKTYEDDNVIGMGGRITAQWLTERPKWWPAEFDWVVGCSYVGLPTTTTPIRNPIGANMSVRRSAFSGVGVFSSEVGRIGKRPLGAEETELFIRIRQHWPDAAVLFEPECAVLHKVPGARANFKYFANRCYAEGLSKAVVSQLAGSSDGLSSERSYTLKTLPLGVINGLISGVKRDPAGFSRAGAIVAGLLITTAGYIRGRLAKGPERNLTAVLSPPSAPTNTGIRSTSSDDSDAGQPNGAP